MAPHSVAGGRFQLGTPNPALPSRDCFGRAVQAPSVDREGETKKSELERLEPAVFREHAGPLCTAVER